MLALKQLAEFTGSVFLPYITPCFEHIYKLLDHHSEDIRQAALDALAQFIVTMNQSNDDAGVENGIVIFVPKAADIIKSDEDYHVVMAALDSFGILLKQLKRKAIFNDELKLTIFTCIQNVLNSKVTCQLSDEPGDDDELDQSEYDEALIQVAGDVIPKFGAALGPDEFAEYFKAVLPILAAKIVCPEKFCIRKTSTIENFLVLCPQEKSKDNEDLETQRGFAYGTLSECFEPMGNRLGKSLP